MLEHRDFQLNELRIDKSKEPAIIGHAAVFDQKSVLIMGMFREIVKPGAFTNTIAKDDIRALWNHDPKLVLGRKKNGTLELSEDKVGLKIRITPPDTVFANDVLEMIDRGDVDQMSFGFRTITDQWRMEDGDDVRELLEVELFEVSPVTFPAYPQTDVSVREVRSFYEEKLKTIEKINGGTPAPKDEKFLARMKAAEEFLGARTPLPDPYNIKSILAWASRSAKQ